MKKLKKYQKIKRRIQREDTFNFFGPSAYFNLQQLNKERIKKILLYMLIFLVCIGIIIYINFKFIEDIGKNILHITLMIITIIYCNSICLAKFSVPKYKKKVKDIIFPQIRAFIGGIEWGTANYEDMIQNAISDYKETAGTIIKREKLSEYIDDNRSELRSEYNNFIEYLLKLVIIPQFDNYLYDCDDSFNIKYNNILAKVAEIKLSEYEYNLNLRRRQYAKYKGLFITFKFPNVNNEIYKLAIVKRGKLKKKLPELFEYSNANLNPKYYIYTNDFRQTEEIITKHLINKLNRLYSKPEFKTVSISVEYGNVNIAIYSNKNWFDVPLFKNPEDFSIYKKIMFEIADMLEIIDIFNIPAEIKQD